MDHNGIEIGVAIEVKNDENINISDVIEVIETDPDFVNDQPMFSGGGEIRQSSQNQRSVAMPSLMQPTQTQSHQPYIKIIEQPASKALRFRYECEGRSAGSIPGASSTPENKTFPTIQVVGYRGRAVVVVSCVTKDEPYRAHPHNLVGREGCKKGVCTLEIPQETMTVSFSNLGIQCVKKKDIEEALRVREEIRVDPFRKGFSHRNQPTQIDLNAVRLCFQVFMEGSEPGRYTVPLQPVVSDVIYDKKAMSDLVICKLSDCSATVAGGKEIILLCEKVAKEDIQVKFFEEKNNTTVWEGFGDFQPSHVHKQVAISFRTPRYHTLDVTDSIKVYIQLWRPSDKATSEPLPFEFLPLDSDPVVLKRKRQKMGNEHMLRHLQEQEKARNLPPINNMLNIPADTPIKLEPRDATSPFGGSQVGVSPFNPGATSPLPYIFPNDTVVGGTPSPINYNFTNNASVPNQFQAIPIQQQNWLGPISNMETNSVTNTNNLNTGTFNIANNQTMNIPNNNNNEVGSIINLDSQELLQINTEELVGFDEQDNMSERFSQNLSLSENRRENMTDSLTRIATDTLNRFLE